MLKFGKNNESVVIGSVNDCNYFESRAIIIMFYLNVCNRYQIVSLKLYGIYSKQSVCLLGKAIGYVKYKKCGD